MFPQTTKYARHQVNKHCSNDSDNEDVDAAPASNNLIPSVPENQGVALDNGSTQPRTSAAAGRNSGSRTAKKKSTSSPPTSVTQLGTYIRAINVFFNQKHRNDVFSLGAAPSVQELDARSAF